ncbi:hypothetical protein FRC11_010913 [Ceratobasidium sp. 423]|nr:hypothetical protein FRC11_010913 [Ceratobasidium sp. 423]
MSTWNTSEGTKAAGVQEQKRVEYRGQSFANCFVNTTRFDYSLVELTQTVNVGVICPGYDKYPIEVSMESTITFGWVLSKDFIGQYYGAGLDLLNLTETNRSDYRKVVLAALEVISTDALTIMRKSRDHLSNAILSTSIFFDVDPAAVSPDPTVSTLAYVNGRLPDPYPDEANIYYDTIVNLATVVIHAVNLDLGNHAPPNIFLNASLLSTAILPNLAPNDTGVHVNASDWAEGSQTFYYGTLTPPYRTWAESLLDGKPVKLDNLTGLHEESVMVTTYLCPTYQLKPLRSLLASVFVGSATMTLSVWGAWMFFTTFLARRIMPPRVICHCNDCERRRAIEDEINRYREANPATRPFSRLMTLVWVPKPPRPTYPPRDEGRADIDISHPEYDPYAAVQPERPSHSFEAKQPSYLSGSTTGQGRTWA